MLLIDFSYLTNRILEGADDLAAIACKTLQLGEFDKAKQTTLMLYHSLPHELQEFVKDAERPQIKKSIKLFNQLSRIIPLKGYN